MTRLNAQILFIVCFSATLAAIGIALVCAGLKRDGRGCVRWKPAALPPGQTLDAVPVAVEAERAERNSLVYVIKGCYRLSR